LRAEVATLRKVKEDWDILERLLEENPDVSELLFERAGRPSSAGAASDLSDAERTTATALRADENGDADDEHFRERATAHRDPLAGSDDQRANGWRKVALTPHNCSTCSAPWTHVYTLQTAEGWKTIWSGWLSPDSSGMLVQLSAPAQRWVWCARCQLSEVVF